MTTVFGKPDAIANARSAAGSAALTESILNDRFEAIIAQTEKDYGPEIATIVRDLESTHKLHFVTEHWHEIVAIKAESPAEAEARADVIAPQRAALEAKLQRDGADTVKSEIHDLGLAHVIRDAQAFRPRAQNFTASTTFAGDEAVRDAGRGGPGQHGL